MITPNSVLDYTTRPDFFLRSGRIRVDLLSYESKTTDKREQYDWRTEKNLDGMDNPLPKNTGSGVCQYPKGLADRL